MRIEFKLPNPIIIVGFRDVSLAAIRMPIPKAAVYEDNLSLRGQYKVRASRQISIMQPVTKALAEKGSPDY